ncbi:ABC-type polysaccharide/polyol phosphate transport system, ATPase component [Desulfocapsa sulfexigens DSM 10523]|uniref:ABC-type polysaccharide/polyol phosphate transport system, ATPase component n=1 Tax=Desulfocapsa sulfexigens (strain DSM 10523 / SB164P1) TaxID=1167006 RepID=M1PH51_DESSD|nr:ABC transporter ATP-binding protein [Desulfocapsa sulfexigens]AGF78945.1 ABC-type polysaccharide/polyol phosphate transport system, ATPase component [Desulfocapsa sulfexigens DSM 10523]
MNREISIDAHELTKTYYLYDRPIDRVKETFHPWRKIYHRPFDAVKGLSFTIHKGESFGIIGRNGSGKSTLLQMICGILQPTSGYVTVNGRVAALLELGAGFNPEFSGRENVYLNGAILGFSTAEIDDLYDEIVGFADIGDFVDQPVKTYSSGMYVRLAFAVQACVEPEILVVDEALSVGDVFFQQKCLGRMRQLRENGTTLLFVSHDMGIVRELCESSVYLHKGRLAYCGPSHKAVQKYYNMDHRQVSGSSGSENGGAPVASSLTGNEIWKQDISQSQDGADAEILSVSMEDKDGFPSMKATIGEQISFTLYYRVNKSGPIHASVSIKNRFDNLISCNGTYINNLEPQTLAEGAVGKIVFKVQCDMEAGPYTLHFSLSSPGDRPNRAATVDETPWLGPLSIEWDYENHKAPFLGMFNLPVFCSFGEDTK